MTKDFLYCAQKMHWSSTNKMPKSHISKATLRGAALDTTS